MRAEDAEAVPILAGRATVPEKMRKVFPLILGAPLSTCVWETNSELPQLHLTIVTLRLRMSHTDT